MSKVYVVFTCDVNKKITNMDIRGLSNAKKYAKEIFNHIDIEWVSVRTIRGIMKYFLDHTQTSDRWIL